MRIWKRGLFPENGFNCSVTDISDNCMNDAINSFFSKNFFEVSQIRSARFLAELLVIRDGLLRLDIGVLCVSEIRGIINYVCACTLVHWLVIFCTFTCD